MLPKILPIDPKGANPTTVILQMFFTVSPTDESQTQLQDAIGQVVTFWNLRTTAWPAFVALLVQMREYYDKNGKFPKFEAEQQLPVEVQKRRLKVIKPTNIRSVPQAAPSTVLALLNKVPMEFDAEDKEVNGFVPVIVYVYGQNIRWI